MKIAITAASEKQNQPVDIRFGRAPGFLVCEPETGTFSFHSNTQNLHAVQGAGIQAAQNVANLGVGAVITGHCGPKAFRVLKAAGIRIFCVPENFTIADALAGFQAGTLTEADEADVEGHWV